MNYIEYFQPCTYYFWQLEDDGEVIAIPGDRTIGYSRHLLGILEPLTVQGLPPFGAFLLVMAATNEDAANMLGRIRTIVQHANTTTQVHTQKQIDDTFAFLEMIRRLPDGVLRGKKRLQLLQVLFAGSHGNCSLKDSRRILDEARALSTLAIPGITLPRKVIQRDIKCIVLLHRKFPDEQHILDAIATLPELPELDLPGETASRHGDLLQELLDEPRTFPVASLVKHLWSGLRIPFHQSDPSDQPFGGISDLSNKGDLDKLLVSEYANDNLVFLSRLANSEALYLHREAPPSNPDAARTVLADVSIRNWGTPKLVAYGIMLALCRHPKTNIPVYTVAVGSSFEPVSLGSKEELISSMQQLDVATDPSVGLRHFLEQHTPRKSHELILVIAAESLETVAVQKVLSENRESFKYLVTVDHYGLIRVYQNSRKGRMLIHQLQLPLEQIWKQGNRKGMAPSHVPAMPSSGPLYPPLLFPYLPGKYRTFHCEDDQQFILSSRYLFRKTKSINNKGLQLIAKKIQPGAGLFAMAIDSTGSRIFLSFNTGNKKLEIINVAHDTTWRLTFTEWRISRNHPQFFFHKDSFWYMTDSQTYKFDYLLQKVEATIGHEYLKEYHEYEKNNSCSLSVNSQGSPVLKNANYVGITTAGHLRINNHQLVMHDRKLIFEHIHHQQTAALVTADRQDDRKESAHFIFKDGSSVTVHETGLITLSSSEQYTPVIYLPAVLDSPIAAATITDFSGNEYYLSPDHRQKKISAHHFYTTHIVPFARHILKP